MMTYIKLGKVRGIYFEIRKELKFHTFFKKNTFHHETIIDIPYAQIIFTSGRWKPAKKFPKCDVPIRSVSNGNKQTDKTAKCPQRIRGS